MQSGYRLMLAGSLLLNLFAAGVIGGGAIMLKHQTLWRAHATALRPIREAGDELPPDARLAFRATMRAVVAQSADLSRRSRQSRRAAAMMFKAPVFDAEAISADLAQARGADVELRARLETAAVAFASGLPVDQRILLAAGLANGGPLRRPPPARPTAKPP